ncbi:MAG: hypothetical protein EOP05_02465 [Proteobacteria bacterium]|nr:MAG: hypothetical protein EOP05_02465 [Pseudomonadota bacterium]
MKRTQALSRIMLQTFVALATAATLVTTVAEAATPTVTLQGRITKADGTPFQSPGTEFKIQVLSPDQKCVLYEETQTKDLSGKDGLFAVSLNDGSAGSARTDGNSWTFSQALSNKGSFSIPAARCANAGGTSPVVYTPLASDERVLLVAFKDPTMSTWDAMPYSLLSHSVSSVDSINVGGFPSTALCRVEDNGTPGSAAAMSSADYTELLKIVDGSTSQYAKADGSGFTPTSAVNYNGQRITSIGAPTAASDATNKDYVDTKVSGQDSKIYGQDATAIGTLAAGDSGKVLTWDGSKWVMQVASTFTNTLANGSLWIGNGSNVI